MKTLLITFLVLSWTFTSHADLPILPRQEFVENVLGLTIPDATDFSNRGITHFDAALCYNHATPPYYGLFVVQTNAGLVPYIDLSGDKLPVADVNAMLAASRAVATNSGLIYGFVNLSGPLMAAPTGQGIIDSEYLSGLGWSVTTN